MTEEGLTVVEFVGLPGAGKSRLAEELVRELRDRGAVANATAAAIAPEVDPVPRLSRKAGLVIERLGAEPVAYASFARAIARGRSTPREAAHRLVQWTTSQGLLARARRSTGIAVLDEGLLQTLWSIGLRGRLGPVMAELERRPNAWVRPELAVIVDVDPQVAAHRIAARSSHHSRTEALSSATQRAELVRGRRLLDEISTWFERRGGQCVRYENPDGAELGSVTTSLADRILGR